jgi:hypothetical protein
LARQLSSLAAEKRKFLESHELRRCGPHVFQQFDALNAAMRELLAPVEHQLTAEHDELLRSLARTKVLGSREFSFVLFNSEILPARLLDLCKVSS